MNPARRIRRRGALFRMSSAQKRMMTARAVTLIVMVTSIPRWSVDVISAMPIL